MSQFSGLYLSALAQNEMPTEREMDVSWYTWDFLVTWMIIFHQAPLSSKLLGQFGRVSPKHLTSLSLRFRRNHESGEDTWGHIGVNGKSPKLAMSIVWSDPTTMTLLPQEKGPQKDQFPTDKMNPFRELGVPKFANFLRHTLLQASLTCPHLPQLTCCAWPGTAAGKLFSVPWQELQKGQMSWTIWQVHFFCDKFWCNFWRHRAHIQRSTPFGSPHLVSAEEKITCHKWWELCSTRLLQMSRHGIQKLLPQDEGKLWECRATLK